MAERYMLQESGDQLLQESGDRIILEGVYGPYAIPAVELFVPGEDAVELFVPGAAAADTK